MCQPSSLRPRFSDDMKEASRPKKTFRAADVRRMHDILSKNMYKIRQKVTCTQISAIPRVRVKNVGKHVSYIKIQLLNKLNTFLFCFIDIHWCDFVSKCKQNANAECLNVLQTMAYTNKYSLPDNSRAREILIRRHASVRRSVRGGSFQELVGF